MRVLSVDYGSKRVGLASGDSVNKIAFPKVVVENKSFSYVVKEILRICDEEEYKVVVFGMPLNMDDEKGDQYKVVSGFVDVFKGEVSAKSLEVEVDVIDERLSSFEADQLMADFKGEKVRKKDGDRDMLAAKVILERWFERQ